MTCIAVEWGAASLGSLPPFFFRNGGFEFQPGKATKVPVHFSNQHYNTAFIESVYVAIPFILIILHSKSETVSALKIEPFR